MQSDRGDMIIDRYLTLDQEFDRKDDEMLQHPVKKLLDLDGNNHDDPERRGNRPDFTMVPGMDINGNTDGVVDILKGMNRLSQKMIKSLENEYSRTNLAAEDADKEEREELLYSDLEEEDVATYMEIKVKQQMASGQGLNSSEPKGDKNLVGTQEIDRQIYLLIEGLANSIDLTKVANEDKKIINAANQNVIKAVKVNAKQAKNTNFNAVMGAVTGLATIEATKEVETPLPPDLLESCRVLHGTCCEFLKHFYIHFQSGEVRQAPTVKKLYTYLKECPNKVTKLLHQAQDNESNNNDILASNCRAYLSSVLASLNLALQKYETAVAEANGATSVEEA